MNPITTLVGQSDLPRYFAATFTLAQKLNRGRVDFVLPDGRCFRVDAPNPGPVAEITVHNPDTFARLIREGDLGMADAYLEGWWSTPDLQAFMDVIHADNNDVYDSFGGLQFVRLWERLRHWMNRNTKDQAKKNISYHYDLGNEFYSLWLDETMTYSSAIFDTGQESLDKAQIEKYKSMVDQMGAKPGDHVLEIGCGWGGIRRIRREGTRFEGHRVNNQPRTVRLCAGTDTKGRACRSGRK